MKRFSGLILCSSFLVLQFSQQTLARRNVRTTTQFPYYSNEPNMVMLGANCFVIILCGIATLVLTIYLPYFLLFELRKQLKESAERIANLEGILIFRVLPDQALTEICAKIQTAIETIKNERQTFEKQLETELLVALSPQMLAKKFDEAAEGSVVPCGTTGNPPVRQTGSSPSNAGFTHVGSQFDDMEEKNKLTLAGFLPNSNLQTNQVVTAPKPEANVPPTPAAAPSPQPPPKIVQNTPAPPPKIGQPPPQNQYNQVPPQQKPPQPQMTPVNHSKTPIPNQNASRNIQNQQPRPPPVAPQPPPKLASQPKGASATPIPQKQIQQTKPGVVQQPQRPGQLPPNNHK